MYAPAQHRTLSAFAASLIVAGGLLVLVAGLSFAPPPMAPQSMLETILPTRGTPPAPEPKPSPSHAKKEALRDQPASAARRNRAAPIMLPPPPLPPLIAPPPVVTAPMAGTGAAPNQGTANIGSGQGAGGAGIGRGGGGSGDGTGTGPGRGNLSAYPRQLAGKLHYWEIPKELRQDHGGIIRLRYRIGSDGGVSDCTVLQSSGLPEFDAETCARITERFRFKPALDPQGRPVPFVMTETHGWDYEPGPE